MKMNFTSIDFKAFNKIYGKRYGELYDSCGTEDEEMADCLQSWLVGVFDKLLKEDEAFSLFVGAFSKWRLDPVSSDREAAAFMMALAEI